ncbi:MAG: response regulator [Betaproteobacteria bacterium]|nr:response regulator [Betaproteobacteria bacterium]
MPESLGRALVSNPSVTAGKILVVDDQPANLLLAKRILNAEGFQYVTTLSDPRQVEEEYRRERFDLVLLDLNMPHLDGFEVMERLRAIEQDNYLPILVLTALDDSETRLRALRSGAKDFLSKPFDRTELITRVCNMLEVRLLHEQVRDQNKILEEKVRERTRELHESRLDIVRRLGRAVEYRDNETGLHILRMSQYAAIVARAAGMTESYCETLLNAAPMHDIGKIGIPDAILTKKGSLDEQEWEIMKTHTIMGASILAGGKSELLEMARQVALSHHECWDGRGYPRGIANVAIPFSARVVTLTDVFDALTTVRPYKAAWSVEDALAYLREHSGKRFDPALVELFLQNLPAILEVFHRHPEPAAGAAG